MNLSANPPQKARKPPGERRPSYSGDPIRLCERIIPADFETETASFSLIERIGWALSDADQLKSTNDGTEEHPQAA